MQFGILRMGDVSVEPSMEEILSSIKRIIAEEGEATQSRTKRPARIASPAPAQPAIAAAPPAEIDEEVLELSDPMPVADPELDTPVKMTRPMPQAAAPAPEPASEPIMSQQTAAASRGSLETLSKLLTKPEPGSDGTLEGLVREMLRPMLREWLDANLPDLVETMVAREIAKITGQAK